MAVASTAFSFYLGKRSDHVCGSPRTDAIAIICLLCVLEALFILGKPEYDNLLVLLGFGIAVPALVGLEMWAPVSFLVLAMPLMLVFQFENIVTATCVVAAFLGAVLLVFALRYACQGKGKRSTVKALILFLWALATIWLLSLPLQMFGIVEATVLFVVALAMFSAAIREYNAFYLESAGYQPVEDPESALNRLVAFIIGLIEQDRRYDLNAFNCNHFAAQVVQVLCGSAALSHSSSNDATGVAGHPESAVANGEVVEPEKRSCLAADACLDRQTPLVSPA